MKLKKVLKLKEVASKEEHKTCWEFNKIIEAHLSKVVKAHESITRIINHLRDNYREKAMILCGQINPETGEPWMKAVQPKIISGDAAEMLKKFESNSYFQGKLNKQAQIKRKWIRLSEESKALMDLYILAPKEHYFVEGFHF